MPGPTLAEIRRRKGIPRTLRMPASSGAPVEVSPLEAAREIRESIRGDALVQSAIDEVDLQNETRRLELESRRAELEAKKLESDQKVAALRASASGNGQSPIAELAFSMVEMMKEQQAAIKEGNDALKAEVQQMRDSQLQGTISELAAQIAELRKQQTDISSGARQPDSGDTILTRIEELSAVREAMRSFSGLSPELTGINTDLQQIIALKRLDAETTMRLEGLKDERDNRDWQRKLDMRKLDLEERRFSGFQQAFDQLAPLLGRFARQWTGLPSETPPGLPSSGPVTTESQACQREGCKGLITVATGQNIAACPDCGTVYQLGQQ